MSDNQDPLKSRDRCCSSKLSVALFSPDQNFTSVIVDLLSQECYRLNLINEADQLLKLVAESIEQIDCFVFVNDNAHKNLLEQLRRTRILLPITIIDTCSEELVEEEDLTTEPNLNPQNAEVILQSKNIEQLDSCIKRSIKKFLNLAPSCSLADREHQINLKLQNSSQELLVLQQRRLAEKLKERLGYLGVYYKRNSQDFYRNATESEQQEILQELKIEYRKIIISYFDEDPQINQLIDKFVNQAFFLD
ncbi:MAG: circadian clock protein KaiA, partial [Xenococcus sp. (in: cyanobacteria)]